MLLLKNITYTLFPIFNYKLQFLPYILIKSYLRFFKSVSMKTGFPEHITKLYWITLVAQSGPNLAGAYGASAQSLRILGASKFKKIYVNLISINSTN